MQYIHYTDTDPARNLAFDEALLQMAEEGEIGEVLRIYEFARPTVVLGLQDKYLKAAAVDRCREYDVPILRRRSGGGTVLVGPGCLLYSVVLDKKRRNLESVSCSYRWIHNLLCEHLSTGKARIRPAGISDLRWGSRKVGGNAQQRKRNHLLHHGTLLYDMDLDLIEQFLGEVNRPPPWRNGRSHLDFVANLPFGRQELEDALKGAFEPRSEFHRSSEELAPRTDKLVAERYGREEWTRRR